MAAVKEPHNPPDPNREDHGDRWAERGQQDVGTELVQLSIRLIPTGAKLTACVQLMSPVQWKGNQVDKKTKRSFSAMTTAALVFPGWKGATSSSAYPAQVEWAPPLGFSCMAFRCLKRVTEKDHSTCALFLTPFLQSIYKLQLSELGCCALRTLTLTWYSSSWEFVRLLWE